MKTILVCGAFALGALAADYLFAQDGPKSTIIFEGTVTLGGQPEAEAPVDCQALYRRFPKNPTRLQAFMWTKAFPPCVWEGERLSSEPNRKTTPRPEPETCTWEVKGDEITGKCQDAPWIETWVEAQEERE